MAESSQGGSKNVVERVPMARPGLGTKGAAIQLLSNHFRAKLPRTDRDFYQYSVLIKYEDDTVVDAQGLIGRKVLDTLHGTYSSQLDGMTFAYDGENTLYTLGALPLFSNKDTFTVLVEERPSVRKTSLAAGGSSSPSGSDIKRSKSNARMKTYKVEIKYATKIPIKAISDAISGQESKRVEEAIRVFDVILKQHASKQNCLLVKQSFFHSQAKCDSLGGGVLGCRGIHSSFRATQSGLSLNMNVTTTMIIKPGPVSSFLLENQKVDQLSKIDWRKAEKTLKNLRIETTHTRLEYKIRGLSNETCRNQKFSMKQRSGTGESVELTVYDYFSQELNMRVRESGDYPCISVGRPKKPVYIPIELCKLVSLQRYTKGITNLQRAELVRKSSQRPNERMDALKKALDLSRYNTNSLLVSAGVAINNEFTQVEGRILAAPQLKAGGGHTFFPSNGKWNFNNKKLVNPVQVLKGWAIVMFSPPVCDMNRLSRDLSRCAQEKGMSLPARCYMHEEKRELMRRSTLERINNMIRLLTGEFGQDLRKSLAFVLCILPDRKNSVLYGPWKRAMLCDVGVVTQCLSPPPKKYPNNQYLTNLLLKMNTKLGGSNSWLNIGKPIPSEDSGFPTLIVGMDVSHGSPAYSTVAVVSSREWPLLSRYRATVRTQKPKTEKIENLFNEVGTEDEGIFSEVLNDFYDSSKNEKPKHIIIFRDGVGEGQFKDVLNNELDQIIKACEFKNDPSFNPKFTVILAQKRHQTRFFQLNNNKDNVPPGTVIDNGVCHPKNYDFYLCAQAGPIGTTRPTHYHVLYDDFGFSPNDLQAFVHKLSYVYQRSTTAISVVAPIYYAHLAAEQMSKFINPEEVTDAAVPQLPRLKSQVSQTMFFC